MAGKSETDSLLSDQPGSRCILPGYTAKCAAVDVATKLRYLGMPSEIYLCECGKYHIRTKRPAQPCPI